MNANIDCMIFTYIQKIVHSLKVAFLLKILIEMPHNNHLKDIKKGLIFFYYLLENLIID